MSRVGTWAIPLLVLVGLALLVVFGGPVIPGFEEWSESAWKWLEQVPDKIAHLMRQWGEWIEEGFGQFRLGFEDWADSVVDQVADFLS
jgi:predicted PurR-regulated permease PerM